MAATLLAKAATAAKAAEHFFEHVSKVRRIAPLEAAKAAATKWVAATAAHAAFKGSVAHAVIRLALLGIFQNFVGFAHFFELMLSFFIVLITVGVVFHRQFAIRTL